MNSTPEPTDRLRALTLLEAADFLRDAHFRDGLSVQEIGTALRHMADAADPMVGSLARDGFGLDEIAAMQADTRAGHGAPDTLPEWLYQRWGSKRGEPAWSELDQDDRSYWEREATAIRRAVARNGFRTPAPSAVVSQPDEEARVPTLHGAAELEEKLDINVSPMTFDPSEEARPRCPRCQLPHDLTLGSLPWAACEMTRRRIAEAAQLHDEGDHRQCCRADCEVLRQS